MLELLAPGEVMADLGGEEFFAGAVAAAEVGPGGSGDEGGGLVVDGEAGAEAGGFGLGGAPGSAYVAECAEGGRVGAGFAGEVSAEAEHVGPLPELEVGELGEVAERPRGADHLAGVLLD